MQYKDLHDILQSHYKVARRRLVDSFRIQAADYHLTMGPGSNTREVQERSRLGP
jgi:hypothetical protein